MEDIFAVPFYQLYQLNQTKPWWVKEIQLPAKGPFFNSTSSSFLTRCNSNFTPAHTAPETGPSYKQKLYAWFIWTHHKIMSVCPSEKLKFSFKQIRVIIYRNFVRWENNMSAWQMPLNWYAISSNSIIGWQYHWVDVPKFQFNH